MKLNANGIKNRTEWEEKGYEMPHFDHSKMVKATNENPCWIHFGAGNIFRGFPAMLMQNLLNEGLVESGILVGEGFDYEIIDKIYQPHDNLSLLVTLMDDGSIKKSVTASIGGALKCNPRFEAEWAQFKAAFANPSLQMASFTITEKGYGIRDKEGNIFGFLQADAQNGPNGTLNGLMSMVASLVYYRYQNGATPLALCSMDNCSHNGEKLETAIKYMVGEWHKAGFVEQGFVDYVNNSVSFPWSMIDKITPRPDAQVQAMLTSDGFESTDVVVTEKHTYIAPFVNAERPQYLVIEDKFPNGRPALEKSGVYFTDRDTVNKVEKMKVCTCLNPLHTCLAIYGCLLGYTLIADEMKDTELSQMVNTLGYTEGLPVVVNPGILDPKDFIDEVIKVRIPNPFMPDTPQRIATDTSQKLAIRFGETIKAYIAREDLDVHSLNMIPLTLAGWCRYLMGVDDEGKTFEPSSDPRLSQAREVVQDIKLGDKGPFTEILRPLLSDTSLFGMDLYQVGLADKVVNYFTELVAAPGAVRATLKKYVD